MHFKNLPPVKEILYGFNIWICRLKRSKTARIFFKDFNWGKSIDYGWLARSKQFM